MANYGDVALNLPSDWVRGAQHDQRYALLTVGHTDGVPDVCLKENPDKEHQFARVNPKYKDEIDANLAKGYVFVRQDAGWVKNVPFWDWNAEGFLVIGGQYLMARPKELFLEDMKQRRIQRDKVMNGASKTDEEVARLAAKAGIEVSGEEDGRRIKVGLRGSARR